MEEAVGRLGDIFFSYESSHSWGVHILVRDDLDFNLQSVKVDILGHYIVLEAKITDSAFLFNYYAPNKCSEKCSFFKSISDELKTLAHTLSF